MVDDEPTLLKAYTRILRKAGYDVVAASSNFEAFATIADSFPDVIISDIGRPDSDGIDFVLELSSHPDARFIPIIILSGQSFDTREKRLLQLTVDRCFQKPVEVSFLLSQVAELIQGQVRHHDETLSLTASSELTALAAEPLRTEEPVPQRFSEITKLGEGASADVWKAYDARLERWVALKIVKPLSAGAADTLAQARALARVAHENIAIVHEVTEVPDPITSETSPAIVMQLVTGVTLAARLGSLALDVDDARIIGTGLLAAISKYHELGVAHSDLHDENVMLTGTKVTVLDPIFLSSSAIRSTATRDSIQARDVRDLRDLLLRLLERASIPREATIIFSSTTRRASLADLWAEFDKALGTIAL